MRLCFIAIRYDELNEDPDSYLGIARNLISWRGYSTPGTETPTAFRPPLYPILIAPISAQSAAWARGTLNILAVLCASILIWKSAISLGLSRSAQILAILVYGFDPLLVRYSSLSMTESVCSLMSALLLWRLVQQEPPDQSRNLKTSCWKTPLLTGIVFGLCVLTRPTFWAFGGLFFLWSLFYLKFQKGAAASQLLRRFALAGLGVCIVVGPWLVRNCIVFHSPILMTSHGGYTVLLGNNEAFYAEVVEQPWGTVWDGSKGPGQGVWAHKVNQKLDQLELFSEVERDRWMANQARETIRNNPTLFLKACWLRFIRFWNIAPSGPAAENIPVALLRLVSLYYIVLWGFVAVGLARIIRFNFAQRMRWIPVILLVIAFTSVHLIYWSNVRMRAPIVPALSLIAAAAISRNRATHQQQLNDKIDIIGTSDTP